HSHLKRLSQNDLQGTQTEFGFKRAFPKLSGQDIETFTGTMFLNVEQLKKQLDKEDFQEIGSMAAFNVLETQFHMFITSQDAKKKTQERSRNSEPSLMPSARSQSTANGSKPKPRATLKHLGIGLHPRVVSQRQRLWKSTSKIFKTDGLRWVPTGKILNSSTTKVDNEPPNGSKEDITNQYECAQTLDVSASTLNLSAGFKEFSTNEQEMTSDHNSSELGLHDHNNEQSSSKLVPKVVPPADKRDTSRQRAGITIPPSHNNVVVNIESDYGFLQYIMNHLKINNPTQDHLVGPVSNLLKGTCKSHVELEYNIEECYKSVTDRLGWNNPEGKEYPFDLSKPLPLIMERGHQVVHVDYFINNDLEYPRRGSSSKKYTTSTTKRKAVKYDIPDIKDMVPSLWSSVKSRPNGKLIYNSIMNGPYVRRMIPEPGDQDREVPVNETFHKQTDDELAEKEVKQAEADDQAI
nr:hypothetical protein [Tanacetum cinerariifolium]